jgi:uncharacterized protein YjdB
MPPTVAVALDLSSLPVGGTTQAAATLGGFIERDGLLDARPIAWQSSATSVATVSSSGLVTGVAPGTAQIRATVDGVTGSATLTVAMPSVDITQAQADAIAGFAVGARFELRGPARPDGSRTIILVGVQA